MAEYLTSDGTSIPNYTPEKSGTVLEICHEPFVQVERV